MDFILNLSCPDQPGLVRSVSSWLWEQGCNIIDSDQFSDPSTQRFFMRIHFAGDVSLDALNRSFDGIADQYDMAATIWQADKKPEVLVLVSKQDHCLIDLLYRMKNGELPINIALVISNHRDVYPLVAADDIDFLRLPITAEKKQEKGRQLLAEIQNRQIDFIVLARYMQILDAALCHQMSGRIINIHHSFLPGFKGARPYQQALGPIIEQGIERVDHRMDADQLAAVGRDIERMVLSKAVRYQAERRILLNGNRTVVFQ